VHFLRFELDDGTCREIKSGAALAVGIDHDHYRYQVDPITDNIRAALAADID